MLDLRHSVTLCMTLWNFFLAEKTEHFLRYAADSGRASGRETKTKREGKMLQNVASIKEGGEGSKGACMYDA